MASVISHVFVATAVGAGTARRLRKRRVLITGALLAVCPDFDAIGHWSGVPYESLFGHRGFTHSLFFAVLAATLATAITTRRGEGSRALLFGYYLFCVGSHSIMDGFTNGGLGIAYGSPFITERYFMPVTPVEVSPIGIRAFFGEWGLRVIWSECRYIWLPTVAILGIGRWLVGRHHGEAGATDGSV